MSRKSSFKKYIGAYFVVGIFAFILIYSIFIDNTEYTPKEEVVKELTTKEKFALAKMYLDSANLGGAKKTVAKIQSEDSVFSQTPELKVLLASIDSAIIERDKALAKMVESDIIQKLDGAVEDLDRYNINNVTVFNIGQKVDEFEEYYQVLYKARGHNELTKKHSRKLFNKLKSKQVEYFPKLRKLYGKLADNNLWEHDMDVIVIGRRYDRVQIIGSAFTANRNIKDFQEGVGPLLNKLRFNRVDYKWIRTTSDYQYYELTTQADSYMNGMK